jgi:hypothetical protein
MERPDFFNINPDVKQEEPLAKRLEKERLEWLEKIRACSKSMKQIFEIPELMTTLYTERQIAVDYYHYLISLLVDVNRKYNSSYAERFDHYTNKAQVRYPTESSKHNRIQVDLADLVEKRELLQIHSKYILSTIQTLDNIIFAIPKRIEIEQISRGK